MIATGTALLAAGALGAGASMYNASQARKSVPDPRDPAQEGEDILRTQIDLAPDQFAADAEFGPKYADLYAQIMQQIAPGMQGLQGGLNTQQREQDIGDVEALGGRAVNAFNQANPQLNQIRGQLSQRAAAGVEPMSMLGAPDQVSATTGGYGLSPYQTVNAGTNYGTWGLLQNSLGELQKGGSLSQTETRNVTNDVLSRFNRAGRANDPSAIAGTALGLDSAQQARLAQRQGAVAQAAGLYQGDLNQQLQAQMANQGAGLTQQGLGASLYSTDANRNLQAQLANQGYNFQTGYANQQAQMGNAEYLNRLLGGTGSFLASTQTDPFQAVLGRSGAMNAGNAASGYGGTGMFNPFNSYGADLYNTNFNAGAAANISAGNNNAAMLGGLMNMFGSYLGGR